MIPKQPLRYFYQAVEKLKKSKKKQINVNRYELFVYQSLVNAIDAGDIYCSESVKFRSFEDDLIDDPTWQKKDLLIKQANLPILSLPVETHLDELENKLEESLREVNRRISDKENKSFEKKQQSSRWSLKYPAKLENDSDSFFDTLTQIDLFQVLRFADSKTDFISSFTHLRGKYAKQKAD